MHDPEGSHYENLIEAKLNSLEKQEEVMPMMNSQRRLPLRGVTEAISEGKGKKTIIVPFGLKKY